MKYESISGDDLYDLIEKDYPYIIEFLNRIMGEQDRKSIYIIHLLLHYIIVDHMDSCRIRIQVCNFFNIIDTSSISTTHEIYANIYNWIENNEELLQLRML